MSSTTELHELSEKPYSVIVPDTSARESLPLCTVLMGGGGSRQNLVDLQPRFDSWWADGTLPAMILACPTGGMSYYYRWEPFLFDEFLPHLRETYKTAQTFIFGMSMGGYGALKFAFARPDQFAAVAAMQPILEPAFDESRVRARNRIHHVAGGPPELVGTTREAQTVEANNPANRARANAGAIRESGLAIYLEAGDDDLVNAHDGVESLHRTLWDLDIAHEYHMLRGIDHVGASIVPRMRSAFEWLGRNITPAGRDEAALALRAQLQPFRDQAVAADSTTLQRYGTLAGSDLLRLRPSQ